jgi:hypothetical protein
MCSFRTATPFIYSDSHTSENGTRTNDRTAPVYRVDQVARDPARARADALAGSPWAVE